MRPARGVPLKIVLAFDTARPRLPAGRLALDQEVAQLEWSPDILERSLAVAALHYSPEAGLHAARTRSFGGLHGFLTDALPEAWGYLVMRRRLAKLGVDISWLTPVEHLAMVGETGRGALVFEPVTTPHDDVASLDLDALTEESAILLEGGGGTLGDTL